MTCDSITDIRLNGPNKRRKKTNFKLQNNCTLQIFPKNPSADHQSLIHSFCNFISPLCGQGRNFFFYSGKGDRFWAWYQSIKIDDNNFCMGCLDEIARGNAAIILFPQPPPQDRRGRCMAIRLLFTIQFAPGNGVTRGDSLLPKL